MQCTEVCRIIGDEEITNNNPPLTTNRGAISSPRLQWVAFHSLFDVRDYPVERAIPGVADPSEGKPDGLTR